MAEIKRLKFATQIDGALLEAVREIAREEGRQIQVLMDEALADLIEKRRLANPREPVMSAYRASHRHFAPLYEKLAK